MRGFLIRLGWVVTLAVVGSFFLPWFKFETAAFNRTVERERLANQLTASAEQPWYQRWFELRPEDYRPALDRPFEGVSGFTLVQWARSPIGIERQKVRQLAEILGLNEGHSILVVAAMLAYAIPALAVLGMALFTLGLEIRWPVLFFAIASIGLYFLARYDLANSLLDRTVAGVEPGIGLWLSLYGLWISGIVLLIAALTPAGKR